jgi:predicted metalloprotease with PDZ domain
MDTIRLNVARLGDELSDANGYIGVPDVSNAVMSYAVNRKMAFAEVREGDLVQVEGCDPETAEEVREIVEHMQTMAATPVPGP